MSDSPIPPPRRVTNRVHLMSLTGKVVPFRGDTPDMLTIEGSPDVYVAIYTTTEQLYEMHQDDGNLVVKLINDGEVFLDELPYWIEPGIRLRVIIDPHRTPRLTTRYREVVRDEPPLLTDQR